MAGITFDQLHIEIGSPRLPARLGEERAGLGQLHRTELRDVDPGPRDLEAIGIGGLDHALYLLGWCGCRSGGLDEYLLGGRRCIRCETPDETCLQSTASECGHLRQ